MSTPSTAKKPMKKAQTEATPKDSPAPEIPAADAPASPRKAKPTRKNGHAAAAQPAASGAIETKIEAKVEPKAKRPKKEKVIRDSFTMPKSDYEKIATLKQKCLDAGISVKKSELLRAGLTLLESIPVKRLTAAVAALETVKTGRPKESQSQ
jgi:hypothetical protein